MQHTVLGLGAATLTAAGSVWYVPAAVQLKAGQDRPISVRLAACACLAGWGTAALLAVLLATTASWRPVWAAAATGGVAVAVLRMCARACGRIEQREEARRWAALRCAVPVGDPTRPQRAFAAWLLAGVASAIGTAAALLWAQGGSGRAVAAMAAVAVSGVFLCIAAVRLRRRRPARAAR